MTHMAPRSKDEKRYYNGAMSCVELRCPLCNVSLVHRNELGQIDSSVDTALRDAQAQLPLEMRAELQKRVDLESQSHQSVAGGSGRQEVGDAITGHESNQSMEFDFNEIF